MKVLVTGGCGHIGSKFIRSDGVDEYDITVVDNLSTQRYCSLFYLPKKIKFIKYKWEHVLTALLGIKLINIGS